MHTLSTLLLSGKCNNTGLFFKSIWPLSCPIVIFSCILKVAIGIVIAKTIEYFSLVYFLYSLAFLSTPLWLFCPQLQLSP